jgi:hypothetical protein
MVPAGGVVETQNVPKSEMWRAPSVAPVVERHTGGRYEDIRAKARRRLLVANVIVVVSTVAVLGLAVFFHALLTR